MAERDPRRSVGTGSQRNHNREYRYEFHQNSGIANSLVLDQNGDKEWPQHFS